MRRPDVLATSTVVGSDNDLAVNAMYFAWFSRHSLHVRQYPIWMQVITYQSALPGFGGGYQVVPVSRDTHSPTNEAHPCTLAEIRRHARRVQPRPPTATCALGRAVGRPVRQIIRALARARLV
jgi:hypothetical protein